MNWKEFKKYVEDNGVKDEMEILTINMSKMIIPDVLIRDGKYIIIVD